MILVLPSLPVTNDELTLSTADGHQTVHSLDAGLHGLLHRCAGNDARGLQANTEPLFPSDWTLHNFISVSQRYSSFITRHGITEKSNLMKTHGLKFRTEISVLISV